MRLSGQGGKRLRMGMMVLTAITTIQMGILSAAFAEKISVRPYQTSRPFEGWGTSLCWWANRVGYSDGLSQLAAEAFFADSGLGMNIVRYNVGGGDDETHHHITRTDSAMEGYAVSPMRVREGEEHWKWTWDWEKDARQRNVLTHALKARDGDIVVELFSNSPPYFMTVSGCSSGNTDPNADNLREDAVDAFGDYLAGVAEHFEKVWNVPIQSVAAMNEPYTNYWQAYSAKQEGCHVSAGTSQSRVLLSLRRALDEKGLNDVLISASDETSIDTQITSYRALSEEAKASVDRIDTHTYQGSSRFMLSSLAFTEGKGLWMSEVDGGEVLGRDAGEMGAALWLAQRVVDDMNGLQPSAWILWQVIDSHVSDAGMNGNQDTGMVNVNGGFWGLSVADHDKGTLIHTMKYYALGQFTRFIRPGYELLSSSERSLAARNPENGTVSFVYVNSGNRDRSVTLDLSVFGEEWTCTVYRTSGGMEQGEHWAEAGREETDSGRLEISFAAQAVTTLVLTPKE